MDFLINTSGFSYVLISSMNSWTGDLVLTLLLIILAIILIGLVVRVPFELMILFTLPFSIMMSLWNSVGVTILIVHLILIAFILIKEFIIR